MPTRVVALACAWLGVARGDGLLSASLERSQLAPECAGWRPAPQFGRYAAAADGGATKSGLAAWRHRPSDGVSGGAGRYVNLRGKFGLLNNRARCLANALAWAGRLNATVVLEGAWELFADAILDAKWLLDAAPADVVLVSPDAAWANAGLAANTISLSCADAYFCGGACDGAAAEISKAWGIDSESGVWRRLRSGGQEVRHEREKLFDDGVLCGYAALAPRPPVRAAAAAWARQDGWAQNVVLAHHQRLETTVASEPVAQMCNAASKRIAGAYFAAGAAGGAVYSAVCGGALLPAALLAASEARPTRIFLASDRFDDSAFQAWRFTAGVSVYAPPAEGAVDVGRWRAPSAMFETPLGAALYKPGYPGGAAGRRKGLAAAVQPVLVDMLLLASADEFWPTPGSTMSQSVCMWRKAWRKHSAVPNIQSCEEIVLVPR